MPNFRKRALEWIKKQNAKNEPKAKANDPKRIAGGVDISNVPPDVVELIRDLDRDPKAQPDKDYLGLIKTYKSMHPEATAADCIKAVNKAVPMAREQFLEKQAQAANRDRDPDPAGPRYSQQEIESYMDQVKRYQLENKCGYMAALKAVDTLKPGLRQLYIRHINK